MEVKKRGADGQKRKYILYEEMRGRGGEERKVRRGERDGQKTTGGRRRSSEGKKIKDREKEKRMEVKKREEERSMPLTSHLRAFCQHHSSWCWQLAY